MIAKKLICQSNAYLKHYRTKLKIQFQRNLDFQTDAIKSITDLFKSQKFTQTNPLLISDNGIISNHLTIAQEQLLENLNQIQNRNQITPSEKLETMNFSIEMETGTGKTYVYLKTIFELFQNYGFKKFIIMVPSVAIREGVLKNLQILKNHFQEIYGNIPYSFFEYNSKKINLTKIFARSNSIQIMIMTIDSINKNTNVIKQIRDNLHGNKPIDLINKTNPILILDEPQNMETEKAKDALKNLNPLLTLRYSATHKNQYNLLYQLSPVTAYNRNLVKKIEVMSVVKDDDFNNVFVRVLDITTQPVSAKIIINKKLKSGIKVSSIVVKDGDDLFIKTNNPEYERFIVSEINARHNFLKFANGKKLRKGEEIGGDREELMKIQIDQTVQEHFEKALKLKPLGIKPLSLFFIDRVDNYTSNDGFIKKQFIKSYKKFQKEYPDFKDLDVKKVHRGYFSETAKTDSAIQRDRDAYELIMRHKERLLSFSEPVQFIFSHSALREGWDNPNVFNICTLNLTHSTMKKRQEIGRGMRLPVNQDGERVHGDQNILTIIANENYATFASTLQKEYEEEYGEGASPVIHERKKRKKVLLKKGFKLNPEFKELWKKIAKKTKYAIHLDSEKLILKCIEDIQKEDFSKKISAKITTASLSLQETDSVIQVGTYTKGVGHEILEKSFLIPNIVELISVETNLTRTSIIKILSKISNLEKIFINPQNFVFIISEIIKQRLEEYLVDGVQYVETENWYEMSEFKNIDSYEDSIIPIENSIYDAVIWDSDIEKNFAQKLDKIKNVKLFIKLPNWFKVDTPIGGYNPDWAILVDDVDQHGKFISKLYFVTETKGTTKVKTLTPKEQRKIECGKKHFDILGVEYNVATDPSEFIE